MKASMASAEDAHPHESKYGFSRDALYSPLNYHVGQLLGAGSDYVCLISSNIMQSELGHDVALALPQAFVAALPLQVLHSTATAQQLWGQVQGQGRGGGGRTGVLVATLPATEYSNGRNTQTALFTGRDARYCSMQICS